jgi:ATP-dependent RNA helicase DeaD
VESFEDLSVAPELSEGLASEGIETPTPLQQDAIPLLKKGNSLVLSAGPGSGLLAAWAVGLLDRIEAEGDSPKVLVLCATADIANRLAESVARMTSFSGHTVAALGGSWVLPDRAHLLFGAVDAVLGVLTSGDLTPTALEAVVVDQAQMIEALGSLAEVERVFDYLPEGTQRVLSALPVTPAVSDLVERHFKRTMTVPTPPATDSPQRGSVRFRITPEPTETAALAMVDELFAEGARHALVFCRNEDRAADVGDYLTLHGFTAGAPGDESVPVWLGVDALEARPEVKGVDGVVVVSCDVPSDSDTLDRRHSLGDSGVVLVVAREVAHLRSLGKRTGYDTIPFPPPAKERGTVGQIRDMLTRAMETEDTAPYLLALEPLFELHDPAEVAAAAVSLLRKKDRSASVAPTPSPQGSAASRASATPAWAKLFVAVGERDGLRAGDLLGAITGEAGVAAEAIGKIDIKESHALVEVHDSVARAVIQAINGTTIKGRSVRADFDRPRRGIPQRGARPKS